MSTAALKQMVGGTEIYSLNRQFQAIETGKELDLESAVFAIALPFRL